MDNEGKTRRDDGISRALDNVKEEYRNHYRTTMGKWFSTVKVGRTFMLEEGHAHLTMPPAIPQQTSALSNGFIKQLLRNSEVELYSQSCSTRPHNNATRTRVYVRVR
jgi:hypothetical protein